MELITLEQIIEILKKENIRITRDQFKYYKTLGMFFAPEKRTKTRSKEGPAAYYSENIIEDCKFLQKMRDDDLSLKEIKIMLYKKYISEMIELYNEAGLTLYITDPRPKIDTWRSLGYLKGKLQICRDIDNFAHLVEQLKDEIYLRVVEIKGEVFSKLKCEEDKKIVSKMLEKYKKQDRTAWLNIKDLRNKFKDKTKLLEAFLKDNKIK